MHICHITSVHPRYDIRIFVKACQTLTQNGFKVSLVVADGLGDEIKNNVNFYDVGKVNGRIKRMLLITNRIFAQVLKLKPDAVHFHDPELMVVGRKLRSLGYKVIYDIHEDVPKQILSKHWIPKLIRPLISKLVAAEEKKACKQFSGIICATEIIQKRVVKYNRKTIALHNYPILAELNSNTPTNWEMRSNDLLYIGSISENRGIIPLVESLATSQLKLQLAGKFSNDSLQNKLTTTIGYEFIDYHGVVDRKQIAELLQKVKIGIVTLLPTPSYIESLPIKLFEYMLSGIPVVASDFPPWRDIVSKYNCGILVDPNNSIEIAKSCKWLIDNPTEAMNMGQNGRNAVLEHFTWENESVKLVDFYRK